MHAIKSKCIDVIAIRAPAVVREGESGFKEPWAVLHNGTPRPRPSSLSPLSPPDLMTRMAMAMAPLSLSPDLARSLALFHSLPPASLSFFQELQSQKNEKLRGRQGRKEGRKYHSTSPPSSKAGEADRILKCGNR